MLVEKLRHDFHELRGAFLAASKPVARALDDVESCLDAGLLQGVIKQFALMERHQHIFVAVHDKKGRIILRNIRDGISLSHDRSVGLLLNRSSHQERLRRVRRIVDQAAAFKHVLIHLQKVRRAEPVAHGLHAAGSLTVRLRVEFFHISRCTQEGNQMSAGGAAPGADAVGIESVLGGVGPHPAHRGLAILDLSGEDGFAAETVADVHDGIASLEHGQGPAAGPFAAAPPAAPVNPNDDR